MGVKLVFPTEIYEEEWRAFIKEVEESGEKMTPLALKCDSGNYEDYLHQISNNREGKNLPTGRVPSSIYFLIEEESEKLLGAIDIRYELNEYLYQYGGNIGYGVRPSERRKGYATQMLNLALEECGSLGLKEVLITCFKENQASARTILNNKGKLENEVVENGLVKQRYWIKINE